MASDLARCVLFDNDGVLVETEHLYFEASRETLAEVGVVLTRAIYQDISLRQGLSLMDLAARRGATPEEVRELLRRRDDRYVAHLEQGVEVLTGVPECLEELRASGRRLAIVTTCPGPHFAVQHRTTGLLDLFDVVLVREDYPRAKPHPDPYLMAADRLGAPAAACVAVEDSERGLASAVAAGIPCFALPSGLTHGSAFDGAVAVLSGASELPGAIEDFAADGDGSAV